jgi:hypothetical protein
MLNLINARKQFMNYMRVIAAFPDGGPHSKQVQLRRRAEQPFARHDLVGGSASREDLMNAMNGKVGAKGVYIGIFGQK